MPKGTYMTPGRALAAGRVRVPDAACGVLLCLRGTLEHHGEVLPAHGLVDPRACNRVKRRRCGRGGEGNGSNPKNNTNEITRVTTNGQRQDEKEKMHTRGEIWGDTGPGCSREQRDKRLSPV